MRVCVVRYCNDGDYGKRRMVMEARKQINSLRHQRGLRTVEMSKNMMVITRKGNSIDKRVGKEWWR